MKQVELLRAFDYDPETGALTWRVKPREDFKTAREWNSRNARYAGMVAGNLHYQKKSGDRHASIVQFNGKLIPAHRIIWTMVNGEIPAGRHIDHINGNPFDNRLCNLRLATRSQNMMNRGVARNNSLGLKGVYRQRNKFVAQIKDHGKRRYLGIFDTKGLAALAYAKACLRYHGMFARIN